LSGWPGYVSSGLRTGFKSSICGCYPRAASQCIGTVTERNAQQLPPPPARSAALYPLATLTALGLADANVIFSAPPGVPLDPIFRKPQLCQNNPHPARPRYPPPAPCKLTSHPRPRRRPPPPPPYAPAAAVPRHRPPHAPPAAGWQARWVAGISRAPGAAGTGEFGKGSSYAAAPGKQCGGISVTGWHIPHRAPLRLLVRNCGRRADLRKQGCVVLLAGQLDGN
jgi:hypothetical protein